LGGAIFLATGRDLRTGRVAGFLDLRDLRAVGMCLLYTRLYILVD
jgi:hypothetical protein